MKKNFMYLAFYFLCFPFIGLAQSNTHVLPNNKLNLEILEKSISTDTVLIIDYSLQINSSGQATDIIEDKKYITPKDGFVFVIEKIKLTNIRKKTIKLNPINELVAKNLDGIKSNILINYNPKEPLSFQGKIVEIINSGKNYYKQSREFIYELKQNESVTISIIFQLLKKDSDQIFIEYVK